jgi:outer membrane lipoprotein SlyB
MRALRVLFFLFLTSATYVWADPVVDPASVKDQDKYYRDASDCRRLAKNNSGDWKNAAKDTVIGAGVGAGTGALIGAIGGSAGKGAGIGAVIGGVGGGGRAVYKSNKNYNSLYRNCMRGRGYKVLN